MTTGGRGEGDSAHYALLVSGFAEAGAVGGGVFVVDDDDVATIDRRPTTGLFFDEGTERWLRAMSARELSSVAGEVVEYSGSPGNVSVRRLATVLDAHDVLLTAKQRLAVSTLDNSLLEIGGRRPRSVHVLPGEPDSWHFNCVVDVQGELFASVFRRGGTFRQWAENPYGSGCVFSLATGGVVADGLSMPHSPRFIDGLWLVCDSARNDLIEVDPERPSERVRAVGLGGYTRGLDFDDDHFYVGISPARKKGADAAATASLAVVDRKSWTLVDRVSIACPEVYEVRRVPKWATQMLQTPVPASRTTDLGDLAAAERPSGATVASTGIPAGLSVRFAPPKYVHAGDVFHVSTRVEHAGSAPLVVSQDTPLQLAYRWIGFGGVTPVSIERDEPLRTPLPASLTPGSHRDVHVAVRAPAVAGRYRFRVVLVQESVRWLDATEPEAFAEVTLQVDGEPTR
jgi:hypothetical protein